MAGLLGLTPLGMATTGLSVAGQIFGAIKGARQAKKQQALIDTKQAENDADYNNSANRSFLETTAAKDAVKQQTEALQDNQKAVAGRAAITGASDEAVVAGNSAVQKNYSDSLSRLASAGTQYQDRQKQMHFARKDSLDAQQMGLNQQKAEGAANLMGNAGDLMNTVTMTAGMDSPKNPVAEVNQFGRTPSMDADVHKIAKSTPVISKPKIYAPDVISPDYRDRQGNYQK